MEGPRAQHPVISAGHVLLGLLHEHVGLAGRVLQSHGADIIRARSQLASAAEHAKGLSGSGAKSVLELAIREAQTRRDRHIDSSHLLLGLLLEEGDATRMLIGPGIDPDKVRVDLLKRLDDQAGQS